jgi:hypothetical protein
MLSQYAFPPRDIEEAAEESTSGTSESCFKLEISEILGLGFVLVQLRMDRGVLLIMSKSSTPVVF